MSAETEERFYAVAAEHLFDSDADPFYIVWGHFTKANKGSGKAL